MPIATATANLISDEVLVNGEDAPQFVQEKVEPITSCDVILKKRIGRITADDFLKYSRRLMVLCSKIYQDSKLDLRKDKHVSLGLEAFISGGSGDRTAGTPGVMIDANRPPVELFREMFENSCSMSLKIMPMVLSDKHCHPFAQVEWTRDSPRTIVFFAQDGGRHDLEGDQRPLEELLHLNL